MKKIALIFVMIVYFCSGAYAAEMKEYTVKRGDDAGNIAWKLGVTLPSLVEANPNVGLEDIKIGQVLRYRAKEDSVKETLETILTKLESSNPKEMSKEQFELLEMLVKSSNASVVNKMTQRIESIMSRYAVAGKTDNSKIYQEHFKIKEGSVGFKDVLDYYVLSLIVLALVVIIIVALVIVMKKTSEPEREQRDKSPQWTSPFTVNDKIYQYLAIPNENGKFPTFIPDGKGGFKCVASQDDLRRSVVSSFRRNPALVEKNLRLGRLQQIGGG